MKNLTFNIVIVSASSISDCFVSCAMYRHFSQPYHENNGPT